MTTEQHGSKTEGRGDLVHIRTDRGLWRPNAEGYTNDKRDAGRWLRAEAERMTDHLGPEKCLQLIPVDASPSDLPAREAIAWSDGPKVREARRGLRLLFLEAPESVVSDVTRLVEEAFDEIAALSQGNGEAPGHTDLMISPEAIDEAIEPLYAAPPSQPEGVREALATARKRIQLVRNELTDAEQSVMLKNAIADIDRVFTTITATTPSRGLVEATEWQPIETAPKDGTPIWLLTKHQEYDSAPGTDYNEHIVHLPRCSIGKWDPEGTSWVNEQGNMDADDVCTLGVTGIWGSGGGWFQPNEVTHWMPLPAPPRTLSAKQTANAADREEERGG